MELLRKNGQLYNFLRLIFDFFRKRIPFVKKWYLGHLLKTGFLIQENEHRKLLESSDKVFIHTKDKKWNVGLVRNEQSDEWIGYIPRREDWPKYERFLINNNISYSFYNIQSSDWQENAKKFNIILWATSCFPTIQSEAKSKIYFLENYLNIKCYPSYNEIWSYEDKVRASYLFKHFALPCVETFVFNYKSDAVNFINSTEFPIISKIATGSSSFGVHKISSRKKALKFINSVFSESGRNTYWKYLKQKDYIYFQRFIKDATFDLRIIVIGDKVFGYYRYAKNGDFRASGSGIVEKKSLPVEAMKIAIETRNSLKSNALAVDMLFSEKEKKYYIIETSIFIGIDTPEQLMIDGIPGYYRVQNGSFVFEEGRYWIQELALQHFFNNL